MLHVFLIFIYAQLSHLSQNHPERLIIAPDEAKLSIVCYYYTMCSRLLFFGNAICLYRMCSVLHRQLFDHSFIIYVRSKVIFVYLIRFDNKFFIATPFVCTTCSFKCEYTQQCLLALYAYNS